MRGSRPNNQKEQAIADDPEISDDDFVIRKIPSSALKDIGANRKRVSKAAFSASSSRVDPERGMSVDLLSILHERGIDPAGTDYAAGYEVLMTLKVRDLRSTLGLSILRRPRPDNPAHCIVIGVTGNKRRKLLDLAHWLRRPANIVKHPD